jgi:hypothetical protein
MGNEEFSRQMAIPAMSEDELRANNYTEWRFFPDGLVVAVGPMSLSNGRLYVDVHRTGYEDCYCYDSLELATAALHAFNPETDKEPTGWKRHPYTGRRRPGGDPLLEYIAR